RRSSELLPGGPPQPPATDRSCERPRLGSAHVPTTAPAGPGRQHPWPAPPAAERVAAVPVQRYPGAARVRRLPARTGADGQAPAHLELLRHPVRRHHVRDDRPVLDHPGRPEPGPGLHRVGPAGGDPVPRPRAHRCHCGVHPGEGGAGRAVRRGRRRAEGAALVRHRHPRPAWGCCRACAQAGVRAAPLNDPAPDAAAGGDRRRGPAYDGFMVASPRWRTELQALEPAQWPAYLHERSGLPGPRANTALVAAAASLAGAEVIDLLLADAQEYTAMCAAAALGRRSEDPRARERARLLATDQRWRVREGVAIGLQLLADEAPAALAPTVLAWADDPDPLVQRAAAA